MKDIVDKINTRLEALKEYVKILKLFEILGQEGIIEKKLATAFAPAVGFRNILIHDYLKIDYEQVADKINNRLGDFEKFAQQIARLYSA